MKVHEAPFSPNYVRLIKPLRSRVITRCFLPAKAVEFNFTRNIMQTEYMAPIVTFRLYEHNRFQMNVSPYDRKSFS